MRILVSPVVAAGLLLGGCAAPPVDTAAASWALAPGQEVGPDSSLLDVLVTRVGCNSGVTGHVEEPDVVLEDDRVVVTFVVTPGEPEAATCQGNPEEPWLLTLPEPLGDRSLVDGQCLIDDAVAGTVFCVDGGVRHRP